MTPSLGSPPWREDVSSEDDSLEEIPDSVSGESLSKRILMTGSRDWDDVASVRSAIKKALKILAVDPENATLIHGAAKGADSLAAIVAQEMGLKIEPHPAQWNVHSANCPTTDPGNGGCWQGRKGTNGRLSCRRAGFRRNQEMIDSGADVLIAFIRDQSKGATGTLDLWIKENKPYIICRQTGGGPVKGKVVGFDSFD